MYKPLQSRTCVVQDRLGVLLLWCVFRSQAVALQQLPCTDEHKRSRLQLGKGSVRLKNKNQQTYQDKKKSYGVWFCHQLIPVNNLELKQLQFPLKLDVFCLRLLSLLWEHGDLHWKSIYPFRRQLPWTESTKIQWAENCLIIENCVSPL